MQNKKKFIIAIVLFIFLGLTVFTFANPANNQIKQQGDGKDVKHIDDDNQKENNDIQNGDTLTTDEEQDRVVTNEPTNDPARVNPVDNSYDLALRAVIEAEEKMENDSYTTAVELVDKVTDHTQKEQLATRLEEVKNGMDAKALVESLQNKTTSAIDKAELTAARTFRTEEEIVTKVSNLANEELKEELNTTLTELAKLLDDTNAPVINIEDEAILSSDTKVSIEDEAGNDFTFVLSKNNEVMNEFENGDEVSDGVYTLTVVDVAFNDVTITFTVDTKAPVINGLPENGMTKDDVTIEVEDLTLDTITVTKQGEESRTVENGTVLTEEGIYTIEVTDKAGHTTTAKVEIDKTAATVTTIKQEYEAKENGRIKTTIIFSEAVQFPFDELNWRKVSDTEYYTYYYRSKEETLSFKDLAGNESSYTFTIDKTAPEVVSVKQVYEEKQNGRIKATVVFSEAIQFPFDKLNWRKVSDTEYETYFYRTKDYTISFKDLIGNPNTYTLNIDKDAPVVTLYMKGKKVAAGKHYTSTLKAVIEDANDYTAVLKDHKGNETDYVSGSDITGRANYTLEVTDVIGNQTVVEFGIDKDYPLIYLNGKKNEKVSSTLQYFNQDVEVKITDLNIVSITVTRNGVEIPFENNSTLTEEGNYTVTSMDKAGNKTQVNFIIDKTAPVVTLFMKGKKVEAGYYTATLKAMIEEENGYTAVLKDHKGNVTNYVSGSDITGRANYTLEVTDKAGNTTTVEFGIDKDYPLIYLNGKKNEKVSSVLQYFNQDVEVKVTDLNLASITVTRNGVEIPFENNGILTAEGSYTVTATDKAGHTTKVNFIIDKTAPKVTVRDTSVEYNGVYGKLNLALFDANEIVKVVINGTTLAHKGKYVDINDGHAYTFRDGINTIEITDKAGNVTVVEFTVDKKAPIYSSLRMVGSKGLKIDGKQVWYAKNADKIYVYVHFKEQLAQAPTLLINGTKEVKFNNGTYKADTQDYIYSAVYTVSAEDNLADGQIQISVSGYADFVGNIGDVLTNEDITLESQKTVIIDTTAPVIDIDRNVQLNVGDEFEDDITSKISDNITATENLKVEIYPVNGIVVDTSVAGVYQINYKISDKAGNFEVATRTVTVNE